MSFYIPLYVIATTFSNHLSNINFTLWKWVSKLYLQIILEARHVLRFTTFFSFVSENRITAARFSIS
jgi:hypothetical protein